ALSVDAEGFGGLSLSDVARPLLRGEQRLQLRLENRERRSSRKSKSSSTSVATTSLDAADTGLFEHLRQWRAELAREQNVPAYVIFHDATLRAIACRRPRSLSDLRTVAGVGEAKLARYGEALIEQVQAAG
ncbi:MAG TPA: HRDC domain-containing protein, partial [Arenimonas sp.]|nr:HRDC domain-containing protein [Arenimonas sp.]